jgi:hypothetical protein
MNLSVKNDWESLRWFIDGNEVEPNSIIRVEIGGETFKVKWRMVTVDYDDMGHTYSATSSEGFIKKKVFGAFEEFKLSSLLQRHFITVKELSQ